MRLELSRLSFYLFLDQPDPLVYLARVQDVEGIRTADNLSRGYDFLWSAKGRWPPTRPMVRQYNNVTCSGQSIAPRFFTRPFYHHDHHDQHVRALAGESQRMYMLRFVEGPDPIHVSFLCVRIFRAFYILEAKVRTSKYTKYVPSTYRACVVNFLCCGDGYDLLRHAVLPTSQ